MNKLHPSTSVIGINAGLGVALYPLRDNLVFNVECRGVFHTKGDEQWRLNFPKVPLLRDLPKEPKDYDVLISSPDCGSGSILRLSRAKELGNHKNNLSLMMFFLGIRMFNPKIFLFENLETMFKSFPKERWVELLSNYRLLEYSVPVTYFGNSQKSRKRLVVIGIRRDLPKGIAKYFRLPDYRHKMQSCYKLYGELEAWDENLCHVWEDVNTPISIHARRKLTPNQIQTEWQTRLRGKRRWESPGYSFANAPGVYRNLKDDYPATARKANRQFDHYGKMLSPRQLARVMGVPDKFKLHFDNERPLYWINKGRTCVTKGMVYEVGKWFKKCLTKSQHIWQPM